MISAKLLQGCIAPGKQSDPQYIKYGLGRVDDDFEFPEQGL